jgi:hypothetical protein
MPPSIMTEKEKNDIVANVGSGESQISLPEPGSQERLLAERKLVRTLDTRVLPTIFIITIMNYIDVRRLSRDCQETSNARPA